MSAIARITSTFFTTVINRLGIRPPFPEGWEMSNTVVPISIVDSDIALTAQSVPPTMDLSFTAGASVAPVAGTVLADTGALAAGTYNFNIFIGTDGAVVGGGGIAIQRRDSANAANIWTQYARMNDNSGFYSVQARIVLSQNERVRVVAQTGFTAGLGVIANIWQSA